VRRCIFIFLIVANMGCIGQLPFLGHSATFRTPLARLFQRVQRLPRPPWFAIPTPKPWSRRFLMECFFLLPHFLQEKYISLSASTAVTALAENADTSYWPKITGTRSSLKSWTRPFFPSAFYCS